MKFTCDQCGTRYSISDEKVKGKVLKIRCKVCEFTMVVRGNDAGQALSQGGSVAQSASIMAPVYETEWYAAPDGQQVGPIPIERIRAMIRTGAITPETVVWNETLSDWTAAEQVEQLASLFAPKPKAPPPLPPSLSSIHSTAPKDALGDGSHGDRGREFGSDSVQGAVGRQLVPEPTLPSKTPITNQSDARSENSGVSIQPLARDTLQYVSPDRSEPGREDVSAIEHLASPPGTVDLADSQDASLPSDVSGSTGQALISAQPSDSIAPEKTELMNVEALVAEAAEYVSAAPIRDISTQKIEEDEAGYPVGGAQRTGLERPAVEAVLSDPPAAQAPVVDDSLSSLPSVDASVMDVSGDSIDDGAAVVTVASSSDMALLNFSNEPAPLVEPEPQVALPVPPASVVTERRDGPTSGKRSGAVSPGLVIAACLIGSAAIVASVMYFSNRTDRSATTTNETVAAAKSAMPAKTLVQPTVKGGSQPPATAASADKTDVTETVRSSGKQVDESGRSAAKTDKPGRDRGDVTVAKPSKDTQKPAVQLGEKASAAPVAEADNKPKKKTKSKAKTKPKRTEQKKTASKKKRSSQESEVAARQARPDVGRSARGSSQTLETGKIRSAPTPGRISGRRSFMLSGVPSSDIPDPTRRQKRGGDESESQGLSSAVINGVVSKYRGAINGCYTRYLKKDPNYNPGRITLQFQIKPSGETGTVKLSKQGGAKLSAVSLTKCLKRLVKRWRFPSFSGKPFTPKVPLLFSRQY